MGLPKDVATSLVLDMAIGSSLMAAEPGSPPLSELRDAVATKGGSTERALRVFNENKLTETTIKAVEAALARNKEIASAYK